jgi:hypothetical protein
MEGILIKRDGVFYIKYKKQLINSIQENTIQVYSASNFLKSNDLKFFEEKSDFFQFQVEFDKLNIFNEEFALIKGYDDNILLSINENKNLIEQKMSIESLQNQQKNLDDKITEKIKKLQSECTHPNLFIKTKKVHYSGGYDHVSETYEIKTCVICGKKFQGKVEFGTYN